MTITIFQILVSLFSIDVAAICGLLYEGVKLIGRTFVGHALPARKYDLSAEFKALQ
jgi:hypothetical protein